MKQEMDMASIVNPVIALLFLFFSAVVLLFKLRGGGDGKYSLPPSPSRWPIIGNLHQLAKTPHRSLRALSEKYGPIMLLHLGSIPTIVVSSPEFAMEIFKTKETVFRNRHFNKSALFYYPGGKGVIFSEYGDHWRQARKISVMELLTARMVNSFHYVREEEVAKVVEELRQIACQDAGSKLPVDIIKMMTSITSNVVTRCVLGNKYEGSNDDNEITFGETLRSVVKLAASFRFEDFFPYLGWIDNLTGLNARLKATSKTINTFIDRVIEEHQLSPKTSDDKKDFVDILLHLQNSDLLDVDMTCDGFRGILLDMLIGGTESSASLMEWTMAELVKNPTIMKKAQEEVRKVVGDKFKVEEADVNKMEYLKCVIKETSRLHSIFLIPRESSASVTLGGYSFPPRSKFYIFLWAIQRDPNLWDRPEEFVPERFLNNTLLDFKGTDYQFFPFGSGRRGCPGITFAVVEMEYIIANLLYWFDWSLPENAPPESLNMDDVFKHINFKKIPLSLVPLLHTFQFDKA